MYIEIELTDSHRHLQRHCQLGLRHCYRNLWFRDWHRRCFCHWHWFQC